MSKTIPEIIQAYLAKGDPSGWFEEIYALTNANDSQPPWADMEADQGFVEWSKKTDLQGNGRTAIVVGCGLGDDAEYLTEIGFRVTAFDVSKTAIEICKKRFPNTQVTYQPADLFDLPAEWHQAFDFVVENRIIQALPISLETESKTAILNLVNETGKLMILCHGREPDEPKEGIPWALSTDDLAFFIEQGMQEQALEEYYDGSGRRFLVLYQNTVSEGEA